MVVAEVKLWGKRMGAVLWDERRERAVFQYDDSFVGRGIEPAPLTMPVAKGTTYDFPSISRDTFLGLPGLLADSLPDAFGNALLNKWLSAFGKSFANPVERLCYQGHRGMGALEYEPVYLAHLDHVAVLELDSLVEVANQVLNGKRELNSNLDDDAQEAILNIIRVGTSAGGQRAKAVIAYNSATGELRSGQVDAPAGFDHWLIKLDGVTDGQLADPKHYGKIEYVHHLMARAAGIDMTECRLIEEGGRSHFMTKRFDRMDGRKIHALTLCAIAHYDYRMPRAYSYEQAFQVMRKLRLSYRDADQMYRRMVFNVVARNQDDHTKNISFLMDRDGAWRLSPAYDISWAYNPSGSWTSQHQMSINGKCDNITRDDLLHVAARMNILSPKAIIDEVCEAVSQWGGLARRYGVPEEMIDYIEKTRVFL